MPRLFTALEIPREAALSLSLLRGGLPGARWLSVENYHITLRFIGDIDGPTADELIGAFDRIDRQNRRVDVQIFATDLNARSIEFARAGRYSNAVAADIPDETLKRHFIEDGDAFRVNKRLRETVVFATQNVISDPPFSKLDIITCRNLMIYLEADVQARMIEMFHFALADKGHLFLGSSENAERSGRLFTPVDKSNRIYRRNDVISARPTRFPIAPSDGRTRPAGRDRAATEEATAGDLARRHLLERFAPAAVLVDRQFVVERLELVQLRDHQVIGHAEQTNARRTPAQQDHAVGRTPEQVGELEQHGLNAGPVNAQTAAESSTLDARGEIGPDAVDRVLAERRRPVFEEQRQTTHRPTVLHLFRRRVHFFAPSTLPSPSSS